MTEEDIELTKKLAPFWKGRSMSDRFQAAIPDDLREPMGRLFFTTVGISGGRGHTCINYEKLLNEGLDAVKREAAEKLAALEACDGAAYKKQHFYQSAIIACDAVIAFAHRYADLAERMAARMV
jgi:formate C-acetyltransferase